MSARDHDVLERVARQVGDGESVDWDAVTTEREGSLALLRSLRLIERADADDEASPDPRRLPFERWGPLELRRFVAHGGFGDVYLARDLRLDCDVALKLDRDESSASLADFVEEARRQASVRHPNVVTIHGMDRFEGRLGLWMEWIDGEPLDRLLEERGAFSADEAAQIGIELCRALAAVHGAGLTHRDVKTTNVMREVGGRIVLMDFGASTRSDDPRWSGTLAYLPPGTSPRDSSGVGDDIYALGVTLYRLTGDAYPRDADDGAGRVVPLRDRNPTLPHAFVEVVDRAIDPDPAKRFRSAGELEHALGAAMHRAAPKRSGLRHALVAAALLVAVVAGWTLWPSPFRADVDFYRSGSSLPLHDGASIAWSDGLQLEIELSREAFVYVLNSDDRGAENLLFPVPGLEIDNPLPAGVHRLPGAIAGVDQSWDLDGPGLRERFLVLAARRPLEEVERLTIDEGHAANGAPISLSSARIAERLRGIGGISPAEPDVPTGGASSLDAIGRSVRLARGEAASVHAWELTLFVTE